MDIGISNTVLGLKKYVQFDKTAVYNVYIIAFAEFHLFSSMRIKPTRGHQTSQLRNTPHKTILCLK